MLFLGGPKVREVIAIVDARLVQLLVVVLCSSGAHCAVVFSCIFVSLRLRMQEDTSAEEQQPDRGERGQCCLLPLFPCCRCFVVVVCGGGGGGANNCGFSFLMGGRLSVLRESLLHMAIFFYFYNAEWVIMQYTGTSKKLLVLSPLVIK